MTISTHSTETTSEYSSSTEAYASIRMYDWVPRDVTVIGDVNSGKCITVSWVRPDEAMTDYRIGISKNADFSESSGKNVIDSSANPQGRIVALELNTKYYLRVYGVNPWNYEWSAPTSFTTSNKTAACSV